MKYQQVVFPKPGHCESQDRELGEGLRPGQVLVQNRISLVGGVAETALFSGIGPRGPDGQDGGKPLEPQAAVVGRVLESDGDPRPGTRVAYFGSHATHAKVRASDLLPLPDEISDERACFIGHAVRALAAPRLLPARLGEHVLVVGMGLCGNLCAQLYAQCGVGRVACADHSEARLGKARACGLIETYDLARKPLSEWATALAPRGAELVVAAQGTVSGLRDILRVVASRGVVALLEAPSGPVVEEADLFGEVFAKGLMLVGATAASLDEDTLQRGRQLLLEWLRWGKLKVEPLITHSMHFTEAAQAYEGLRDRPGEFVGIVLNY